MCPVSWGKRNKSSEEMVNIFKSPNIQNYIFWQCWNNALVACTVIWGDAYRGWTNSPVDVIVYIIKKKLSSTPNLKSCHVRGVCDWPMRLIHRWGLVTWYRTLRAPLIEAMWPCLQLGPLQHFIISLTRPTLQITTGTFQDTLIHHRECQPGSTQTPRAKHFLKPANWRSQTFIYLALPSCAVQATAKTNLEIYGAWFQTEERLICSCGLWQEIKIYKRSGICFKTCQC